MQQCRPNRWVSGSAAAFAGGRCPLVNAVRIQVTVRTAPGDQSRCLLPLLSTTFHKLRAPAPPLPV